MYGSCKSFATDSFDAFYAQFTKQKEYLDSSRPTAVNLSWALKRMDKVALANKEKPETMIDAVEDCRG